MNQNLTYQTGKQAILKRMLRIATERTGVGQPELLDPMLRLFTESMAEEVHRVSDEIDAVESRMLESVSRILCPDLSLWAHPAHCILHAIPQEGTLLLTQKTPFILKDRKYLPPGKTELKFHPVCNTSIRKGNIRYLVYNGLCCSVDADLNKTLVFRSHNRETNTQRSYWIGLELDKKIEQSDNLSFYIDFPGVSNKDELMNLLRFSSWKLNGKKLDIKGGLHVVDITDKKDETINLFVRFEPTCELNENILDIYNKHFITLCTPIQLETESRSYPSEFADYFSSELLQDFTNPMLWFEIELPQKVTAVLAESLTISINAFPVANQYLCSKTQEVNEILQVIPLETGNHQSFLSVESVIDSGGRQYYELPFANTQSMQYETYSLRRGGYERYNSRDASEYLSLLLDLLANQSSLDDELQDEDTREELSQQVQDLLKQMKKVLSEFKEKYEVQYYILIDRPGKKDVFFVDFWLTDCEKANGVKKSAYFDLNSEMHFLIDTTSVFSLSQTTGGRPAPDFADRQKLRMQSLSRHKMLVTYDDITCFSKKVFNDVVDRVEVRPGIMEEIFSGDFLRTTDVFLVSKQNTKGLLEDRDTLFLKSLLEKNSPEAFNYRVFIDNN